MKTANEWKTTEIEGKKTAVGDELSAIEGKKRAIDKTAFEEKTTTGDEKTAGNGDRTTLRTRLLTTPSAQYD